MGPELTLFVIGLAVVVGYVLACAWWPFVKCPHPRCQGGRIKSPSGKAWRRHWWCGGKGSRIRWGRRVFDIARGRGGRADV